MLKLKRFETVQKNRNFLRHLCAFLRSLPRLVRLVDMHRGCTVFVVGSGPSLRETNLALLKGQVVLFLNHSRQLTSQANARVSYTLVQDTARQSEILNCLEPGEICLAGCDSFASDRFSAEKYRHRAIWYMPKVKFQWSRIIPYPTVDFGYSISSSPLWAVYAGYSVVFSGIQIAYLMGAKKIVLIGIDMNYKSQNDIEYGVPSVVPPEFNLNYEENFRSHFINARQFLEGRGCELLYATPGGVVDVLPKISLEEIIKASVGGSMVKS